MFAIESIIDWRWAIAKARHVRYLALLSKWREFAVRARQILLDRLTGRRRCVWRAIVRRLWATVVRAVVLLRGEPRVDRVLGWLVPVYMCRELLSGLSLSLLLLSLVMCGLVGREG